jgi:hypothetical protein
LISSSGRRFHPIPPKRQPDASLARAKRFTDPGITPFLE